MTSTTKDISVTPAKNAVTSPTDKKELQADVDRKMRMYQVFSALESGKYPSNAQINKTLDYGINNSPIDESKLSEEGRQLIEDFRAVIETSRVMVAEKNADELFQNFLYSTRKADSAKLNPKNVADAPISKEDAENDGQRAAENLKTLGKLLFTNSEVRKLLKDIGLLARDVGADAATKVAEKARPDEDQLNQIDEPAPSKQWIGKDGETRGPNDPVPDTGIAEKRDQVKEVKDQAANQYQQAKDEAAAHGQDAANRVGNTYTDNSPSVSSNQNTASGAAQEFANNNTSSYGANSSIPYPNQSSQQTDAEKQAAQQAGQEAKNVAAEKANLVKSKIPTVQELKDKVPQEHKDKAKEYHGRAVNYLKEKVPEERRDRFIYRLKKVITEQQEHSEYQEAVDFFLGLIETYHGHAKNVTGQAADHSNSVTNDPHYVGAYKNLRTLLERFANNSSMQPIFDSVDNIYSDVQNDSELRSWFSQLDTYVRRVLQEPGYVMRDECDREGRELRDNGKGFFQEKYRPHREAFINSVQDFFQAYADDPLNVRFGQDWKRLMRDLTLDGDGNLKYKPALWNDVRSVILPELLRAIGYFPIPRIEYTDNQFDLVIENLILDAPNLLPNSIEMEARNYFKLSAYDGIPNKNRHELMVEFHQVQTDLKDVSFYFKKKTGFPRLSDHGLADITIAGDGISGKIHLASTGREDDVFKVKDVKIKIDTMKFKIRDSKHQFLYSTLRPLANNIIKSAVSKAMELAIRNALDQTNQQLSDIKERLDDAKDRDDVTRMDVIKSVFNEKKAKAEQEKQKLDERNPQFKISASRDSKILSYEGPNSMVAQQAEREKMVHAAEHEWKSPAFDWVSELKGEKRPTV